MNILEDLQNYVADRLNADPQLSACPFLVENRRDVDFQIKQALGKQGIVGLVMTPRATYAGAYMDVGIAWQIDELEIDVVENVTVNRGKKDNSFITGQDAAMRLFEVLCPLSGEHEGQFSPVSYSEGEDNSLLVNRAVLKCLVHRAPAPSPAKTVVRYTDGRTAELDIQGELSAASIPDREYISELYIGDEVTSVGDYAFDRCSYLETVVIPESVETIGTQGFSRTRRLTSITIKGNGLKAIGAGAFVAATALTSISLPDSVVSIGRGAFEDCVSFTSIVIPASVQTMDREVFFGCSELMSATFSGKDKAAVKGMENYPWALQPGCVVHCADGDIVIGAETVVQYKSGLTRSLDIEGQLTYRSIPSVVYVKEVAVGNAVTSIGEGTFERCHDLTDATIPGSVRVVGDAAFLDCVALTSLVICEGVETIEGSAFTNCRALSAVTLPASVTSIGDEAFFSCEALYSVTFVGKDRATVQGMSKYPWRLQSGCVVRCSDGDIVI